MSFIKRDDDRYHMVKKDMMKIIYYEYACHPNWKRRKLSCRE
jgi:hypothetical protein